MEILRIIIEKDQCDQHVKDPNIMHFKIEYEVAQNESLNESGKCDLMILHCWRQSPFIGGTCNYNSNQ